MYLLEYLGYYKMFVMIMESLKKSDESYMLLY